MGNCAGKPEADAPLTQQQRSAPSPAPAPIPQAPVQADAVPKSPTPVGREPASAQSPDPVVASSVADGANHREETAPPASQHNASTSPPPPPPDAVPTSPGAVQSPTKAAKPVSEAQNGTAHSEPPAQATTQPSNPADLKPPANNSQEDTAAVSAATTTSQTSTTSQGPVSTWDKAKMLFTLMRAEELLNDLHDLKYIGAGGYGKVFKAVWRSAPVAVKLVPSHSSELFKSSSYKEALLCKELCHPNIVQTYETRCAQLTEEFVHSILVATETPLAKGLGAGGVAAVGAAHSYGSQEFVSGDGFGLPSPVPDMNVKGCTLPEAAAKWNDILFTTGAKAGDFLTVIIMDFCDYGSLVRPIVKGMFRPFSASGNDREARVRYRALLRTAKEIAQGLEHLHYLNVVHGDLKPGNVLLKGSRVDVRGFNAQVIDFGLSHMVQNSNPQKVSKAGGTLVYAAPEVFSGRVGKAADVYSLGIILWEMVTGSQPYKDLAEGQIVIGVQKGGLRPAWPPGQLPQLQELYERCVAQDPESRPKAKEVVQFLTQIEMDLRAELRAAQKQAQQAQMMSAAQQQAAIMQQQEMAALQAVGQAAVLQQHAGQGAATAAPAAAAQRTAPPAAVARAQ